MLSGMADAHVATTDDLRSISVALAAAFWDDPVTSHVLPEGAPSRRKRLETFMRLGSKGAVKHRSLYATSADGGGPIAAAAVWKPPGHWRIAPSEMLPAVPAMLYALRGRARVGMQMLSAIEKEHPTEPHWYLEILGTHPDHQGKGLGSTVMRPVLDRCDAEGVPAYLESSKEQNIPFYERHGFRVTKELRPPGGAPTLWAMWRDPQVS